MQTEKDGAVGKPEYRSVRCRLHFGTVLVALTVGVGCTKANSVASIAPSTAPSSRGKLPRTAEASIPPPQPVLPKAACFWGKDEKVASERQESTTEIVNKLREVSDIPYICSDLCKGGAGCGDVLFWRAVQEGEAAIPLLIDKLDDTTPTDVNVPNFGGKYALADVSLSVLRQIVSNVPYMELLHVQSSSECGQCSWWRYVRASAKNRRKVKEQLRSWVQSHKLIWMDALSVGGMECVDNCKHPAGGRFAAATAKK